MVFVNLIMSCIIYCLYYDDASFAKAQRYQEIYPEIVKLLKLGNISVYFEGQVFPLLFERIDEWKNKKYVGIIGGSNFAKKCGALWDFDKVANSFADSVDVIGFFPAPWNASLYFQSCAFHPYFGEIWSYALGTQLGYTHEQITEPQIPFFASNYWMARPSWLLRYIEFYELVKNILQSSPNNISQMLHSDSNYQGCLPKEDLIRISGKPYYTHHPFIMERMPCFFFHTKGAKITRLCLPSHVELLASKELFERVL